MESPLWHTCVAAYSCSRRRCACVCHSARRATWHRQDRLVGGAVTLQPLRRRPRSRGCCMRCATALHSLAMERRTRVTLQLCVGTHHLSRSTAVLEQCCTTTATTTSGSGSSGSSSRSSSSSSSTAMLKHCPVGQRSRSGWAYPLGLPPGPTPCGLALRVSTAGCAVLMVERTMPSGDVPCTTTSIAAASCSAVDCKQRYQ